MTVQIGYCTSGDVRVEFNVGLSTVMGYCQANGIPYAGEIPIVTGPRIAAGRNRIVRQFLAGSSEWLLMIDTDMTFDPDVVEQFLQVADEETAPIVGGLCFGVGAEGLFPTLYKWNGESFNRSEWFDEERLIPVDGTGAACLMIHRTVLEKMATEFPEPWPWFQETTLPNVNREIGEDMTFCLRARAMGYPIVVAPWIKFGHVKPFEITQDFYLAWTRSHRLIVTGTGRSGTGYLSQILQKGMIPADHERFFNPAHRSLPAWARADVSWMAAPYLHEYPDAYTIHLVREPLATIASLAGNGMFDDDPDQRPTPYVDFLTQHLPQVFEHFNPINRAARFYLEWNSMIDATIRLRVEDQITPDSLQAAFTAAGSKAQRHDIANAISAVKKGYNGSAHPDVTWDDIDKSLRSLLQDQAKRYGYFKWGGNPL